MANPSTSLPLYERVARKNTIARAIELLILSLLLSLLAYRILSFEDHGFSWLLAFLCESWFAFIWVLTVSSKWNQVEYQTYPQRVLQRKLELPPVDMFVTTADPVLEPPILTVNTVLSLLALDYPADKLACYVSDDGGSPLTFYSLVEASKFAKLWVPFCKKYSIQVRAPFRYFSGESMSSQDISPQFQQDWNKMKDEYEQLSQKIEDAAQGSIASELTGEFAGFLNIQRRNHASIVKVIWENKEAGNANGVLPHLVYISREKRPKHPHHSKAGAMNVLEKIQREGKTNSRREMEDDFQQRRSTIFVDNLPNGIRKGFMYNLFSRFGRIRDCFIPNKKSRITGQSFGFVRYESSRDAFQAVDYTNGTWIWGQELLVNIAKFLKKQDSCTTQIYNRYSSENPGDRDFNPRNRWRNGNQHFKIRSFVNNGNSSGYGKELEVFQKKPQIQMSNPPVKNTGERGREVWRRKEIPESSNQGGDRRLSTLEDEGKGEGKTINIQAVGNGWLYRSAVGKLRLLISDQELEILFKKEKIGSVHIKPMGGRYVIITFSSEDRRNEALKEKWLELWFDEINPWSGEAAKEERFVWIACYGMPLNAWNVPSFRAIGSIWGCFIEVDNDTLKETSYAKGKVLIATENSNKIEGEVKLKVNGRIYSVRVEEEDTFRTVSSKGQASNSEVEEEDDYVEDTDDDRDTSSKKEENPMDDMENQRSKSLDDMAKNTEEEDVKSDNRDINGSHQYGLEEEPDPVKPPTQEKTIGEGRNEESFNSIHGLESIVQDSQSPLIEECVESANHCSQFQIREAQQGNNQEQVKEKERVNEVGTNPVAWDSNVILRPSQVQGINLLVDLNPSAVRKNIRGNQFEASMSTEGEDIDSYIMDSQEQEQNAMDKELRNTIITGNNLGIKFNESGVLRMKKMIEDEHKELIASLKNNTFAPLMRDQ